MRVGYVLLVAAAILLENREVASVKAPTDEASLMTVRSIEAELTGGRLLRRHESDDNPDPDDEERARGVALAKIDDLVNPAKLEAAMNDVTKMKVLFKLWNADPTVSSQVIKRLSANPRDFVENSFLILRYNVYRMKLAEDAAKKVDALVDPKRLNAALNDLTKRKHLFRQWNADETIAMQVIEKLSSNPLTFATYSPLIWYFNAYRTKLMENAAKVARNAATN